ncbi:MAG: hypothetical protein V1703_01300 [Candidatus Altiarchaeota archaeon]
MTDDKQLEVRRQLFHLVLGSTIAVAVWLLKPHFGNIILVPLLISISILLAAPKIAPKSIISNHLLNHFERKEDLETFPYKGAVYYGIGIIFPIIMLPLELACVVILILSIGDAISTLFGKFYGRVRIGDKSLEGALAFILSSFIGSLIFLSLTGNMDLKMVAFELSVIGSLIELQAVINDNVAVPLFLSILAKLI